MSELLDLLRARAFARRTVTLSSGKQSDWFVDCKQAVLSSRGHVLVGRALFDRCLRMPEVPTAVAGVELGGCSLASAVATHSAATEWPMDAMYVRKEAKAHGSARRIEGANHLPEGTPVVVLEDVVTTGGSTLRAVQNLRDHGFQVLGVVAIVDRGEEGGAEALAKEGLVFDALYGRPDFMGTP
ncbi:MAG: orotate phosphoribosyltransferase [Myxococcales bacterium]|nr:orotate phosphoribosyltransferase [Myxococcales bacterium]